MEDGRRITTLVRQAWALVEGKQAEAAVARFDEALSLAPGRFDLLLEKGVAQFKLGLLEGALATFRAALLQEPGEAVAYHNCAKVLIALDRPEEALATYEAALQALPDSYRTLVLQGSLLRTMRRLDEALDVLDRATQLRPREPDAFLAAGQALRDAGHVEQAIQSLLWCQGLAPANPEVQFQLGLCLEAGGYVEQAIDALAQAVRREPEHTGYLTGLARVLNAAGHARDALECAARALAIDPELAEAWLEQGVAELALGEEPALGHYHRAVGLHGQGEQEQALEEIARALALRGCYAEAKGLRGRVLLALDRPESAAEAWRDALDDDPGAVETWLELGRLLWYRLERRAEAAPCFRRAAQIEVARWFELPAEIRAAVDELP